MRHARHWTGLLSAGVAGAMLALPAHSQDAPAAAPERASIGALESITVKGTKRETDQQETPLAVSTITDQQLANTFKTDITAVSQLAPNVTLNPVAGFRAVAGGIRGTGGNQILVTSNSSVAVLVDEFGLNSVQSQFVNLFDIEQIEIFRGPQGTLFGKNATGGAIVIETKRPVINEFSGDIELKTGFYSVNGAKLASGKVAINVPIVEDKLAIRMSAIYDYDDGYYRNNKPASGFPNNIPIYAAYGLPTVNPPLPPELDTTAQRAGEHLNGTDVFAGKVKALFTPSDNYEAYFIFEFLRDRSDSPPVVNESPAIGEIDPFSGPQNMLLPRLGFDGVNTVGLSRKERLSTGISNNCIGGNPRGICVPAGHRVDVQGYHLHQSLDLDDVTFKLITGYREMTEILPSTYSGEAFATLFDASRNSKRNQLQLELRAATTFDGPLNFVAGGVYSEDNLNYVAYSLAGLTGLLPQTDAYFGRPTNGNPFLDDRGFINLDLDPMTDAAVTAVGQKQSSYAFYLDGSYNVTDRLKLTGGVRYTYDRKLFSRRQNPGGPCTALTPYKDIRPLDATQPPSLSNCLFDARSNAVSRSGMSINEIDPFTVPLPDSAFDLVLDDVKGTWDKITWRAVVDYKLADTAMAYVSYSTGYMSGGFTEQCSSVKTCRPYDPETNWNLEAGLKADFFDNTLRTNLAVFYTRFSDLLRAQSVPFTNRAGVTTQEVINVNAGKSRAWGVELETTWVPTDNLRFNFSAGYLDHDYKEFVLDLNGDEILDPVTEDIAYLTVPFSPRWKLSGGITYDMLLGNSGTLTANTTVNYSSVSETLVYNSLYTQLEARTLWDANLTWRDLEERYRVTLYAKNLLNQIKRNAGNSVGGLWAYTMYGAPREIGIEVGFHF
ncbi:TonB-dependent receptor [Iodidimonas sp. SYSU 1G8]|uniref:TonB-dependent receptor n=1 Tax=Iodidimonas sp. SYSU 1G8 TaxID=3133967 RepID=UPI0031FF0A70